jgi:hypothetical protein
VIAVDSLTQAGTEKAHAVEALSRVEPERLRRAVLEVLDARAFALWVSCMAQPERELREPALGAIRSRYPQLSPRDSRQPVWTKSLFFGLVRTGEAEWRQLARDEEWYAALRYQVVHHPRYHRLVHYNQLCGVEWERSRPISYPSFDEWLRAADAYCLRRPA